MSTSNPILVLYRDALELLQRNLWLWALPLIVMTLLAAFYAAVTPPRYRASQALVVRDEAVAGDHGRFESVDMMKTFQETILEVARNRIVVAAALRDLGPPSQRKAKGWPKADDIDSLQECISVNAPKGAEFGRTEVIYLSVTGRTPEEAMARTDAVCDQLERHLAELRRARANSVVEELERSQSVGKMELEESTVRLEQLEKEVGKDLGELRILNESGAGDSNLRISLNQVKAELRQTKADRETNKVLYELLQAAEANPDELLTTPGRLLDSQAGLRRLKEGLVDAQLRTSQLRGRMQDEHPMVMAAIVAEREVRQNLHQEITTALRGVEAELRVIDKLAESLETQHRDLQSRMDRLASVRARYSNLVDDVRERTAFVQETQRALSEIRAAQSATNSSSLLTRFHEPSVDDSPVGPSNLAIVATGASGGLAVGIGLLLLTMPLTPQSGRRWTDYLNAGRRATDRFFGRRAADRPEEQGDPTGESSPSVDRRRS